MKKVICVCLLAFVFIGCSGVEKVDEALKNGGVVDNAYNVGKAVYQAGKTVVPLVPMSDTTRDKLKALDGVASSYDKARTEVRSQFEKKTIADGNSTQKMESSSALSVVSNQNIKEIE